MGPRCSHFSANAYAPGVAGPTCRNGVSGATPATRAAAARTSSMVTSTAPLRPARAGTGELFPGVVRGNFGRVGDRPAQFSQQADVLDGAGHVPRRLEFVARLVIIHFVVVVANLLGVAAILPDVLHWIGERQRRDAGL